MDGEDTLDGTKSIESVQVNIRIRPLNEREKKAWRGKHGVAARQ